MLELAFRSIVNDPKSSILYVLTIAFLVMVISAPIAVANGYSKQLSNLVPEVTSNRALIVSASARSLSDSILEYSLIEKLERIGFEKVFPQLIVYSRIEGGHGFTEARVRGVDDPEGFYRDRGIRVNGSEPRAEIEANVGVLLAKKLRIKPGDQIKIIVDGRAWNLTVAGVMDCSCPCDDEALVTLRSLWRMSPGFENKVTLIELVSSKEIDLNLIEKLSGVKLLFERPFKETALTIIHATFQSIKNWTIPLYFMILAAAYFAASKISADSEREVAILRCIGASRANAFKFVFSKSMLILGFATAVGLALGVISAQVILRVMSIALSTNLYEAPSLTPVDVLQVMALTLSFAAAGVIYPALKASRREMGEEAWFSIYP